MRRRAPWRLLLVAAVAWAAGCARAPAPANPALWEVTGPGGERAWLFGTIHALPAPLAWRTERVAAALDTSDELIVEIAALNDTAATRRAFLAMATGRGEPPLQQRVPPADQAALAGLLARAGLAPAALDADKSWAAALTLANAAAPDVDPGNGVDRALLAQNRLPIGELEGARRQFAVFDHLPEPAQRRLLAETIASASTADADMRRLAAAWARGDMAAIAGETDHGLLADATLREALYTQRNGDWASRIAAEIRAGRHPFVAVGAAHMAGRDGLPVLLAARGFGVRRVE